MTASTVPDWVDVSSNNLDHGPINIAAYAASGRQFLMRKVSQGTGYHWLGGDTIARQCHDEGLADGHYHWLTPDVSAADQADYFLNLIAGIYQPGDVLMNDFERTSGVADPADEVRAEQLMTFNAAVLHALPTADLTVYTGNWYVDAMGPHCVAAVAEYDVILSDYGILPDADIDNPHGFSIVARQFTNAASVPGISGAVDCNRWMAGSHIAQGGGTVITPPAASPSVQEDDMPSYFVPGKLASGQPSGHNWIVAPGFASRTVAVDAANWQKVANDPTRTDVVNADMTYAQLVAIPDVSTSSNGHQGAT